MTGGDHPPDAPGGGLLALLVLDGLLLGAFSLVFAPLYVGAVPLPLGAVLTILVLPWLVLRAGAVDPRPLPAGAPALAWFAVLCAFGLTGPGGDVILALNPSSAPGTLLLFFGGVVAALWAWRRVVVTGGVRG